MSEYTGKKWFTIHRNDAGSEAYRDEYVKWLESKIEGLKAENDELRSRRCPHCAAKEWSDSTGG